MSQTYINITIIFTGVTLAVWFLISYLRSKKISNTTFSKKIEQLPKNKTIIISKQKQPEPDIKNQIKRSNQDPPKATPVLNQESAIVTQLQRNLTQKLLGDQAKLERLIDFERKRNPTANLKVWLQSAIERLEQDNR